MIGTSRTDVSTYLQLTGKIKSCHDVKVKINQLTERKEFTKTEASFSLLRDEEDGVETYCFECQKNQVLSKVPDQEEYYSRQFDIFNYTAEDTSKTKLNTLWLQVLVGRKMSTVRDLMRLLPVLHHGHFRLYQYS